MKIRFCEHNKGKGKVFRKLTEEFPDANIKIKSCIKQCGSCRDMPVAIVDKKKISAKDGEELYRKLAEIIRSEEQQKK
jgi:uncharacterized protein YuzB (UPF0349 family)